MSVGFINSTSKTCQNTSVQKQKDEGGDPDESDEEGQEIRCGSVRVTHVNDRSLCLGTALRLGKPLQGNLEQNMGGSKRIVEIAEELHKKAPFGALSKTVT